LTTVYPIYTTGVHGNSGGKSAGKDVFPSGKGRKRLEISGDRYSQILWEQDAAGPNPATPTSREPRHAFCVVEALLFTITILSLRILKALATKIQELQVLGFLFDDITHQYAENGYGNNP